MPKLNLLIFMIDTLSGFPNHCNGAEGVHDFGDLCKYGHARQAKGGTGASPGTHPTLETNTIDADQASVMKKELIVAGVSNEFYTQFFEPH